KTHGRHQHGRATRERRCCFAACAVRRTCRPALARQRDPVQDRHRSRPRTLLPGRGHGRCSACASICLVDTSRGKARMLFTLEALHAKHGDSLLLHYGKPGAPNLIVIDGGPAGVYKTSLRPRLTELKQSRSADAPLTIRMMMVSHLDDDHING